MRNTDKVTVTFLGLFQKADPRFRGDDGKNAVKESIIRERIKMKSKIGISLAVIICLCCIGRVEAGGISTPFGKVVIENLSIGKTYSTAKLSNTSLTVMNSSEGRIGLEMEIFKPLPGRELPEGCESIPDTSWIRLDKYAFSIAPGEEAGTNVNISIPENAAYKGKKYIVYILSRTTEGTIRMALESALILGISENAHQSTLSNRGTEPDSANFLVAPESFSAQGIALGKRYSIKELAGRALEINNMGEKKYTRLWAWVEWILKLFHISWEPETGRKYIVSSISVPEYLLREGYAPLPDEKFLKFKDKKVESKVIVEINGKAVKEVEGFVEFPQGMNEYKGKKYVLVIQVESAGVKRYVRGFIETAK
jgi:hypothetical protein